MNKIIVDQENIRIDKFISQKLNLSRTMVQEYIEKRLIKINNVVLTKANKIVKQGDVIEIGSAQEDKFENFEIEKQNIKFYQNLYIPIIYEDENIICLNKPVINVNKVGKQPSLFEYLLFIGKKPYLVHRLDKQTTGCLVVAKNYKTAYKISNLFKERKVKKKYFAIVEGRLKDNVIIEAPIYHTKNPLKKQVVSFGKGAKTIIKIEKYLNIENIQCLGEISFKKPIKDLTLLDIEIVTGRTHQIRVHLSNLGFPIVGDTKYGSSIDINNGQYFLLHSYFISFELDGKDYSFKSLPQWAQL